jgi:hypothetical protein
MFNSLRTARAAALHLEVVRVRRIKLIRHVTLSIVMLGLSVVFYLTMSAGNEANRLEWFALAGASLVIALSEGIDAFAVVVADGWDYGYQAPRISILDRFVLSVVTSTVWPKPRPVATCDQTASVRPLS